MSPAIPEELFQELGRQISRIGGFPMEVVFESCRSGPTLAEIKAKRDPFSSGQADIAILCAPTYVRARVHGVAELLGYTPIFQDPRCGGRAVYYSDIMVGQQSSFQEFEELRGGSWAYNDTESLSGYFSMLSYLKDRGEQKDFFQRAVCSGGHRNSLELLEDGRIDCAAIDANLLLFLGHENSVRRIRKIGEIGPFPAPPLAISSSLPSADKARLREAVSALREDAAAMQMLKERFLLEELVPVDDEHYRSVGELLSQLKVE